MEETGRSESFFHLNRYTRTYKAKTSQTARSGEENDDSLRDTPCLMGSCKRLLAGKFKFRSLSRAEPLVDGAIDTTSTSSNCIYRAVLVEREIDVRCVPVLMQ